MNEMTSSLLGSGDSDSSCLTSSTTCTSLLFSEESLVVSDDSFLEEVKKNAIKRKVIKPRLSVSVMRSTARRSSDGNSPVAVPIPRKSIALQSPLLDSLQVKTHSPLTSRPSVQPDSVVDSHTETMDHYAMWTSCVRSIHSSLSNRKRGYRFFS